MGQNHGSLLFVSMSVPQHSLLASSGPLPTMFQKGVVIFFKKAEYALIPPEGGLEADWRGTELDSFSRRTWYYPPVFVKLSVCYTNIF